MAALEPNIVGETSLGCQLLASLPVLGLLPLLPLLLAGLLHWDPSPTALSSLHHHLLLHSGQLGQLHVLAIALGCLCQPSRLADLALHRRRSTGSPLQWFVFYRRGVSVKPLRC